MASSSLLPLWTCNYPYGLATGQASLSITSFQSLLKLLSIQLVMLSNHFILCRPLLLLPSVFPSTNESVLRIRWPKSGASALILPMNIQDRFPFGLTGLISLQSKGLSQEPSPTPQFKSIDSSGLNFLYGPTLTSIHDCWRNHSFN